jgi:cell pole-organizing protein PopZ
MEDILSSIRRVIARDEAPGSAREVRVPEAEDILDLEEEEDSAGEAASEIEPEADAVAEDEATADAETVTETEADVVADGEAVAEIEPEPETVTEAETETVPLSESTVASEELASEASVDAARQSLDALTAVVTPAVSAATASAPAIGGRTMEDVVIDALRPMLKEWLDAHLPALVEAMVAKEISRIVDKRA